MTVIELLQILHSKKIKVTVSDEKLKIDAPQGAMTAKILNLLKTSKQELIDYLNDAAVKDIKIEVIERTQALELSFAQQRLWFIDQMDGGSAHYNMDSAMLVKGDFNLAAAQKAFVQIIQRHEPLRTVFKDTDNGPVQIINQKFDFKIEPVDLTQISSSTVLSQTIDQAIKLHSKYSFNLAHDLMLRVSYLKTTESEGYLLFNVHHIASDGWSTGILVEEFITLYHSNVKESPNPLPPLTIQYADYAHWQRKWLTGEVLERQLNYWEKKLAELPHIHSLPLDFERPQFQTFKGDIAHFLIDTESLESFKKIALKQEVTLFMLLHAVFSLLLSRYSNNADIVIGTPVANRMHKQLEPLIGFFVNTLVLRSNCSNNPSFVDYLKHIKSTNITAQANQDVPFEYLVDRLKPNRSTSHNALFQIMLSMDNNSSNELQLPGVKFIPKHRDEVNVKFDLVLNTQSSDAGLICVFEYNTSLFKPETIERLSNGFKLLVQGIIKDAESPIADLPVISDSEINYLTKELNSTQVHAPVTIGIHQTFEQQVKQNPTAVAIISDKEENISYQELNVRANQLAHYLISHGVYSEVLVGLFMERSVDMIVALLAILKAGGAYVPLDPDYPQSRIDFMIDDTGITQVICQSALKEKIKHLALNLIAIDESDVQDSLSQLNKDNPSLKNLNPKNLAYVIYTSGSTGQPKGVMVEHQSVTALVIKPNFMTLDATSRFLLASSVSFDAATLELWGPLLNGGQIVVYPEKIMDLNVLNQCINRHQVNSLWLTAGLFDQWSDVSEGLHSLKWILAGGDVLSVTATAKVQKSLPNAQLINGYGPTENTTFSCCHQITNELKQGSIPIGKAVNGTEIFVLSSELNLLPVGVIGELYLGGIGLSRAYLNQPVLTTEKFINNPFGNNSGSRLYKTGDLVRYLNNGVLEFIGRIDDQVKIRGFRIELGEIEYHLSKHSDVNQAIVLVQDNSSAEKIITAYFTSHSDRPEHELIDDIRVSMQQFLPGYMVPSHLIYLSVMPLTENGKINRRALPELYETKSTDEYIEASGKVEFKLAKIWSGLLKIPFDKISANANFFDLGGHSLLSIRLLSEIRAKFECELSVKTVFETPKLSDLAEIIESSTAVTRPIITALTSSQNQSKLSYAQQRLWFIDQMDGGSAYYNMPSAMRITGRFNVNAAEEAFKKIIKRHQILRTVYADSKDGPVQLIQSEYKFKVNQVDYSQLSDEKQKPAIEIAIKNDAEEPFNLSVDLMLRVSYLKLNNDEGVLLFNMHHIASDGWSIGVLVNEFVQLYRAISNDCINPLSPLSIQYSDYAHWQRQWLSGEVLENQLDYWDKQLADLPQVHSLPLDFERPEFQTFNGALCHFKLDDKVTANLKLIASENKVTLFMLIHAVFSILLSRYSNATDIIIGTPVANRLQKELEPLIGFFVNTLVLRADCSNNPSFRNFLEQIKEVNLNAQENQDVPFEHLVDRLNPSRNSSHNALFQIMLSMNTNEDSDLNLPEVSLSSIESTHITSLFDLSLNVVENDGLAFSFEYNTDLFEHKRVESMAASLLVIFTDVAKDNRQNISQIPILNENQQHHLLTTLNDTAVNYPTDWCIHELFEQQVAKTPENLAVIFEAQTLTYQQLNQRANQLAHHLLEQGVKPDDFVGLCVERSVEMMIGLLAILKAGGAYLPLDPSYPKERLEHMLNDSGVNLLLTQQHVYDELVFEHQKVICIDNHTLVEDQLKGNIPKQNINLSSSNLAYIIYTSGSTGQPKGAAVEHRNETNLLHWYTKEYTLNNSDKMLILSAIGFDLTQKNLFAPLICGASVQFATARFYDVNAITDFIQRQQITITNCAPSVFYPLVETQNNIDKLSSLRCVLFGGEAIAFDRLNLWLKAAASDLRLINMYGPTECTDISCAYEIPFKLNNNKVPIGTANDNVKLLVLNEQLQLAPMGTPGELCVGGFGVSRGYLNQLKLTADKFIPNPFSPDSNEKIYRTGDSVRWNKQAQLEFIGRIDNQIKIRGFRVELGEIEYNLNKHISIKQSVVVHEAIKQTLHAYIVPASEALIDLPELRLFLKKSLPDYMIPLDFVVLNELPLTTHGKIDKKALSGTKIEETPVQIIKPKGSVETQLVQIWSELLEVAEDTISTDGNFFELGGHSLLLTNLLHRVTEELGVQLNVKSIFHSPTIAEITKKINASLPPTYEPLIQQDNKRPLPLSYGQYRIWFIEQIKSQTNEHNMAVATKISGDFKVGVLEQALNSMLEQHDILRTKIILIDNTPMQVVEPAYIYHIDFHDLTALDQVEKKQKISTLTHEQDTRAFDLSQLPLLSILLLKVEEGEFLLHFNQHHIISDGWSQQLFFSELMTRYKKINNHQQINTALQHLNYADYAVWQQQWLQSETAAEQRLFWKAYLDNCNEQLYLPIQNKNGTLEAPQNQICAFVEPSLRNRLKAIAHAQKGSLFNVLHSGFALLLSRLTGEIDFNLGLPVTGRHIYGTQNMLGMFLNTLPIRHQINLQSSFKDLLNTQIQNTEQVLSNQDIPLEQIIELTECERLNESTPLFQILFNMLSIPENTVAENEFGFKMSLQETAEVENKFNLTIYLKDSDQGIHIYCHYNSSVFAQKHIEQMISQYISLLKQIAADINLCCTDIALNLAPNEINYERSIATLNETEKCSDVTALFRKQAKSAPTSIAISDEYNDWSYESLLQYSFGLAHELKTSDVQRGDVITILASRQANLVAGILAALQMGCSYSVITADMPINRIIQHLEIVQNAVTLLCEPMDSYQTELINHLQALTVIKVLVNQPNYYQQTNNDFDPETDLLDSVACITFTSGSSGIPKAIQGTHMGLCGYLAWVPDDLNFNHNDHFGMLSGLVHDPLQRDIFGAICTGATLVIPSKQQYAEYQFSGWIKSQQVSILHLTPSMAEIICMDKGVDLSLLKIVFLTGETLKKDVAEKLLKLNPELRILNCYGATETQRAATYFEITDVTKLASVVPIALSTADTRIRLINQSNNNCGIGEVGVICIESCRIAKGYLNDDQLTAQRFSKLPDGLRRYITGDLGVCLDGQTVKYLGRQDSQVNIRGYRIELGEIEYQISSHEQINSCTAIIHNNEYIIAYFTVNNDQVIESDLVEELKVFLPRSLPEYMLPTVYMLLNQMPLTVNRKVDHKALPVPKDLSHVGKYTRPSSHTEVQLSIIWSRLLKLPENKISSSANFFELGGHSLLLLKLISEIRQTLKVEMTIKHLFDTKDLKSMAVIISSLLEQADVVNKLADASDDEIEEIEF